MCWAKTLFSERIGARVLTIGGAVVFSLGMVWILAVCKRGADTAWEMRLSNRGLPPALGRGVCETKSKKGRARDRKSFLHRVCCA